MYINICLLSSVLEVDKSSYGKFYQGANHININERVQGYSSCHVVCKLESMPLQRWMLGESKSGDDVF